MWCTIKIKYTQQNDHDTLLGLIALLWQPAKLIAHDTRLTIAQREFTFNPVGHSMVELGKLNIMRLNKMVPLPLVRQGSAKGSIRFMKRIQYSQVVHKFHKRKLIF